jgi:hypothetical protein
MRSNGHILVDQLHRTVASDELADALTRLARTPRPRAVRDAALKDHKSKSAASGRCLRM